MGVKILSWEEFNKKEGGGKEVHIFSDDTLANAPTGEFEEIEEDGDEGTQEIENNQAEEEIDKTPKETEDEIPDEIEAGDDEDDDDDEESTEDDDDDEEFVEEPEKEEPVVIRFDSFLD